MNNQNKQCSLHSQLYQYFCEKCYEPVCRQCTLIGPHNTPIHSITALATAYERRVHEIKDRIAAFLENKPIIVESIGLLNRQIEQLKYLKEVSLDQNQKYKNGMFQQLQRHQERVKNQMGMIKQQIQEKVNTINDLGHSFETLTDEIEIISSHSNVLQSIKECLDRLNILLGQKYLFPELPKELSDLRLDLKSIEKYQELIQQKTKLIKQTFDILESEKAKIQKPTIDYVGLLKQLEGNITDCIQHNVCHFCGVAFTFNTVNTTCLKNNSTLDVNQYEGFCEVKPDSIRWSTHRHFFGSPASKYAYFKQNQHSSFDIHLRALLLKLKSICLIKKINIQRQFEEADKDRKGACNRIEMNYVLRQVCGLTVDESQIMLTICDHSAKSTYVYEGIVNRLKRVAIDPSEKTVVEQMRMMNPLWREFC